MIELSVVVPSYETRDDLLACLASVEAAVARMGADRVEVVVVDNGSRDGSARAVAARHPGFRLLAAARNVGFARAVNRGLRSRRGRHALILNSDTLLPPDFLTSGLERLSAAPAVGLLSAALRHPDGRPQHTAHALPGPRPGWRKRLQPARLPVEAAEAAGVCPTPAFRGAAFFVHERVLEEIGLLDEGFFFFFEDTEYCWRVGRAGFVVAWAPELPVLHALGASSKRRAPLATRVEFERSRDRYLRRVEGPAVAWLDRRLRAVGSVSRVLLASLPACVSSTKRAHWRQRAALALWHLRGRPAVPRLADALAAGTETETASSSPPCQAAGMRRREVA